MHDLDHSGGVCGRDVVCCDVVEDEVTTKAQILRVIRENCINCVVGAISVIEDYGGERTCVLYPFRFGTDPSPARKGNLNNLKKAHLQTGKKSSDQNEMVSDS